METGNIFSCDSCGKTLEIYPAENFLSPAKWVTLTYWEGIGAAEHYDFCSQECLEKWLVPTRSVVPEVYLKIFETKL